MSEIKNQLFSKKTIFFLVVVIFLSFLTYFLNYGRPTAGFWDEGYHIAAAQKYLNGIYFMEPHPPLGKLLIALGEKMFYPNGQTGEEGYYDDKFIKTDEAKDYPKDFSFIGYRFFSALLGWLTAPLLFLIFLYITRNSFFSAALSCLYIFDNALIVHLRGAMLEGPLIFFTVLITLIYFLLLEYGNKNKNFILLLLAFGATFGLLATTKVFGLVMILLLPAYLYKLLPDWKKIGKATLLFFIGFIIVYVSVWQIHFALGKTIQPALPDNGYYKASTQYKLFLSNGTTGNILNFPTMIIDSLKFVGSYNRGVAQLNIASPKENGSPFYLWPFGAKSISYRWDTNDGISYRYTYLQSNPVVWFAALFAIIIACSLVISSWFFQIPLKHKYSLTIFTGIYVSYMIAVSFITRVLYLYSYFIPHIISFIILVMLFAELQNIGKWKITEKQKKIFLYVFMFLIFIAFVFYSPLTYGFPLTDKQFQKLNILPIWGLKCEHCPAINILGFPFKDKTLPKP